MHNHSADNPGSYAVIYCRHCGRTSPQATLRCPGCKRSLKDEHVSQPVISAACRPGEKPDVTRSNKPQTLIPKKIIFRLFVVFIVLDVLFFMGVVFYLLSVR